LIIKLFKIIINLMIITVKKLKYMCKFYQFSLIFDVKVIKLILILII